MSRRRSDHLHGTLLRRNGVWIYQFTVPGAPRRTETLGSVEKYAIKRQQVVSDIIDQVIARNTSTDEALVRLGDERPIVRDVEDYQQYLEGLKLNSDYVKGTISRVKEMIDLMGATRLRHITQQQLERAIAKLRSRRRRTGGKTVIEPADAPRLSDQTIAHFVTAVKQFMRRMRKLGRLLTDPLETFDQVKIDAESAGIRREASVEEVCLIVAYANTCAPRKWNAMKGSDRAMLYLYAFTTGLRVAELRCARTEWLRLTGETPVLHIPGEFTKNGKPADQPLPAWLAMATQTWLGERQGLLFPRMPQKLLRVFQGDREAAREAWINDKTVSADERKRRAATDTLKKKTNDGVLVFHSFRHGYVSMLANTEVPVKLVQVLARHADIRTTMNRYAKARTQKKHDAIATAIPATSDLATALLLAHHDSVSERVLTTTNEEHKAKAKRTKKTRKTSED